MKRSRPFLTTSAAAVLVLTAVSSPSALAAGSPKPAAPPTAEACPREPNIFSFTNVKTSERPTNLYSAYARGPATISYNQTTTATASASMTTSVTAEAGVIFAKASATLGVTVGASYSSAGGFSYSFPVPSGQRKRIHLYQQSRYFVVTKKYFHTGQCKYLTSYSHATNAPKKVRDDEWKLES